MASSVTTLVLLSRISTEAIDCYSLSTRFCAERLLRGRSVSSRDNFIIQRLLLQICSCVDRPLRGRCHRVWLSSNAPFNAQCCVSTFLRTSKSTVQAAPLVTQRSTLSTFNCGCSCSFYRIHRLFLTSRIHRDDFSEIKAIVFRSTVWVILLLTIYSLGYSTTLYQRDVDNRGVALLVSRTTCFQSYQHSVSTCGTFSNQPHHSSFSNCRTF